MCKCMEGYYGPVCDKGRPDNTTSAICDSYDVIAGEPVTCRLIPRRDGERINTTSLSFAFNTHSPALVMARGLSEESDGTLSYVLTTSAPLHGDVLHHTFTTAPLTEHAILDVVEIAAPSITAWHLPDETSIVCMRCDVGETADVCRFRATKRACMSASQ